MSSRELEVSDSRRLCAEGEIARDRAIRLGIRTAKTGPSGCWPMPATGTLRRVLRNALHDRYAALPGTRLYQRIDPASPPLVLQVNLAAHEPRAWRPLRATRPYKLGQPFWPRPKGQLNWRCHQRLAACPHPPPELRVGKIQGSFPAQDPRSKNFSGRACGLHLSAAPGPRAVGLSQIAGRMSRQAKLQLIASGRR